MQPAAYVPRLLRAALTPQRQLLARQFARFGTVGVAGAIVDVATVYAAKAALGLYFAGLLAYAAAVTTTWALNRAWTFAGRGRGGGLLRQWLLFVGANGVGFMLNRGTFFVLVTLLPFCARYPVFAILAGAGAGMFANFNLSRSVVFSEEASLRSRAPLAAAQPAAAEAAARAVAGATATVAAGMPE